MALSTLEGMAKLVGGVILLALSAALLLAYNVIGSHVDADGWLHEPFVLIPLAWLSGLSGVAMVAVAAWGRRRGPRPDDAATRGLR